MDSRRISLTSAVLTALVAPGSAFNPYAQLHFEQPVSASANDEEMIKWRMKPVDCIFGRLHININIIVESCHVRKCVNQGARL